jgi:hypothetical protein
VYLKSGISHVVGSAIYGANGGSVMLDARYHHCIDLTSKMFNTSISDQLVRRKDTDVKESIRIVDDQPPK